LETITSLSLQSAVLIGVIGVLTFRRRKTQSAHRLWAVCHMLLLLQFLLAFGVPHPRLFCLWLFEYGVYFESVQNVESGVGQILMIVWLTGVLVSLFLLILGTTQTVRILSRSKPVEQHQLVQQPCLHTGGKPIGLLCSEETSTPFCWQIHQPVIVLPRSILSLSADELAMIIRHETEHLRAGHPLHLFLQRLVEAVFWFHPLVWWSSRQAVYSREFFCDNQSVHSSREALVYLKSLLHFAERQKTGWNSLSAGFVFRNSPSLIQQRVSRLTSRDWSGSPAKTADRWTIAVILITALLSLLLWVPLNVSASNRSFWSPWPSWSTHVLHSMGIPARDYEIDGHRLRPHDHD
ncbi:MAG: M56 family metallopeptidase, partial [Planctomycetaceae bacterium]|nr:M56 family metallopeptidase [Planctomycetaceae bacterium]